MPLLERAWQTAVSEGMDPEEAAQAVADPLEHALSSAVEQTGEALLSELDRISAAMLAEHRRLRKRFERRLERVWGKPLDLLYMMLVACQELGDDYNQTNRPQAIESNDIRFEALVTLHARACLVASAIFALLRTGHAMAARAHWRTLHEIAVVAAVLAEGDNELSNRYLFHSKVEAYEDALIDEKFRERTQREPWERDELEALRESYDEALRQYSTKFKRPWAWASGLTHPDPPTFRRIEELSGLDHLRPDYRTASHLVHAGSSGTSFVRRRRGDRSYLLAGPTNQFLVEPGHGMAVSILQITSTLVIHGHSQAGPIALSTLNALQLLTDRIGEEFVAASDELEELEARYQRVASRGSVSLGVFLVRQWFEMIRWSITRRVQGKRAELVRSWKNLKRSV